MVRMDAPFPPVCVVVGASDSAGCGGIGAALKTYTALSCYGAGVVTAVTAQGLGRVVEIHPIPEHMLRIQLEALAADLPVAAVQIGLCPSAAHVRVIARWLREHPRLPVVVDPSAADATGIPLMTPETLSVLRDELLPRATLAICNRSEAAMLAGLEEVVGREDMEESARRLLARHGCPVLVTGGGLVEGSLDVLAGLDGLRHFTGPSVSHSGRILGAGATHAAAVAVGLARGDGLRESIMSAKLYITAALAAAPRLPSGLGTPWHAVTVREQIIVDGPRR